MKYFILQKDKKCIELNDYLKQSRIDPEFARFIRRESLGEILVEQSNDKPIYLQHANKLGFRWEPNAEIGQVQYDYKANLMRRLVQEYARQLVHELDLPIYEVNGANMFSLSHPVVNAYASLFDDRLYQFKSGNSDIVMSYDASYPQFNIAARSPLSYKQLPFAHFSISDCYRHEQHGEMMLLLRQRRFFMPDIHPYFKDINEAFLWFPKLQAKVLEAAQDAKRQYHVVIDVPSEKIWQEYRNYIEKIPYQLNADVLVNIIEDNQDRYWIINVDYKIIDQLGQSREIGCIQIDIGNASRLDIHYIDKNGERRHPIIIHSAIPGGIERYLYVLFDQYEQEGLPLWIEPIHIRLLPVGEAIIDECKKLAKRYERLLRIEVDDRSISIGAKIKAAHEDRIPHKVVIGSKEKANSYSQFHKLAEKLARHIEDKPFIQREWPVELSRHQ